MASWTTPRTWVTAETPTASMYNEQFRDNMTYLYDGYQSGKYTGTGLTNRAVAHGMGRIPDLVRIFDETSGMSWCVPYTSGDTFRKLYKTDAGTYYSGTVTNTSSFQVGISGDEANTANQSGRSYSWIAIG